MPHKIKMLILLGVAWMLLIYTMGYTDDQYAIAAPLQTPTLQITATPNVFAWHTSACTASNCWDGIVSGVTMIDQAEALLEAKYGQAKVITSERQIQWNAREEKLVPHTGWLRITDKEIVLDIYVFLQMDKLTVADLIAQYGAPSSVYVGTFTALCVGAELAFPNLGILAWLSPLEKSIGVQADQFFHMLIFSSLEDVEGWAKYDTLVLDWQGYADYCQLAEAEQAKQ
ncbi:MAG: hypothetical protein KF726_08645 [Anaerolineae bacterium]|nr:hypothetical protein [Anaerolineae bacterium]